MDRFAQARRNSRISTAMAITAVALAAGGAALAQDLTGTLKKISAQETLTIGHRESSAPFSFYDEKKQPVGFAVELCERIALSVRKAIDKPQMKVAYRAVNAQTRIAAVVDGAVDLECGTTTNMLTRQRQVDFSAIYFTTGTRVLSRKSAAAREIEDFQGKTVGVVAGSTNERAIKAMIDAGKLANLRLSAVKDYAEGLAALEANSVEAFATDDIVLYDLLSKSRIKGELEVVGRFLTYDPYGLMMRRDDPDFRLVVNRTLADLFRTGEIKEIYAKWFDPLGVPLSPLLKAGFELQALPE